MKFTRSTWISVSVTLFLVAAIVLLVLYRGASNDRDLAQSDLSNARVSLAGLNSANITLNEQSAQVDADAAKAQSNIDALNGELDQAALSLKQTQANFPVSVQTIELNEMLLGFAKASNLTVTKLSATEAGVSSLSVGGAALDSTTFVVEVSGKMSDILNFVDRVASETSFKTAQLAPVVFQAPQPLTQAQKDEMRASIKADLVAQANAGLSAGQKVAIIETAVLEYFGKSYQSSDLAALTQRIKEIITEGFNVDVANKLAADIANAIAQNLADSLIGTVAQIYGDKIAELIAADDNNALSNFLGNLGPLDLKSLGIDITGALSDNIKSALPGEVINIITNKLQASVSQKIEALVSADSIDSLLAAQVADAERPSATITVTIYSYKGG